MSHQRELATWLGMFFLILICTSWLCLLSSIAYAQVADVKKGDRVKLLVPAISQNDIIGSVVEISPYAFTVLTKDSVLFVPHSTINWLAISKGKKRNTLKGALIGGLTGGLVLSFALGSSSDDGGFGPDFSGGRGFLIGAGAGLLYGGAIGALVGTFIRTDRWERVPLTVAVGSLPGTLLTVKPAVTVRVLISKGK